MPGRRAKRTKPETPSPDSRFFRGINWPHTIHFWHG
jgi:hypothetical protein